MKALISFLILVPLSFGCGERDEVDSNRGSLEAPVWIRTPGTDQALGIARFADEGSPVLTGRTDGGSGRRWLRFSISAEGELQWMTILGSVWMSFWMWTFMPVEPFSQAVSQPVTFR